jgi:hypothetical protein
VCSNCGAAARQDLPDNPTLICGCDRRRWFDDKNGGYWSEPTDAKPVDGYISEAEEWDRWIRRR